MFIYKGFVFRCWNCELTFKKLFEEAEITFEEYKSFKMGG